MNENSGRHDCEFGAGVCKREECPCGLWYAVTEERKMLWELLDVDSGLRPGELNFIENLSYSAAMSDDDRAHVRMIHERVLG